VKCVINVADM